MSTDTADIRAALRRCSQEIVIQWVPGHAGVPGNELADQAAKDATTIEGPARAISFKSARTIIKQHVHDKIDHEHTKQVYSQLSKTREMEIKTRSDQTTLAQIRTGHHKSFMSYVHDKLDANISPACPLCNHSEHNVSHWLACPGTLDARMRIFGETEIDVSILSRQPKKSLELARRTLLRSEQ